MPPNTSTLILLISFSLFLSYLTSKSLAPHIPSIEYPSAMEALRSTHAAHTLFHASDDDAGAGLGLGSDTAKAKALATKMKSGINLDQAKSALAAEYERELRNEHGSGPAGAVPALKNRRFTTTHKCDLDAYGGRIEEDLKPFKKDGIKLSDVVWAQGQRDVARIAVRDGVLYLYRPDTLSDARWDTAVGYITMLMRVVEVAYVPNVDFVVNLLPEPRVVPAPPSPSPEDSDVAYHQGQGHHPYFQHSVVEHDLVELRRLVPVFSAAKAPAYGHQDILIPDASYPLFEATSQRIIHASMRDEMAWSHKAAVLFWRGSSTGGVYRTGMDWRDFPRLYLCAKSSPLQADPRVDAALADVVQTSADAAAEIRRHAVIASGSEPIERHQSRKYALDVEGNTVSDRFKALLLGTSAVFKDATPFSEWFTSGLVPWVHYIPVDIRYQNQDHTQSQSQSLTDRIDWAMKHDRDARRIALRATEFAVRHLRIEDALCYWHALLSQYAALQQYKAEIGPSTGFVPVTESLLALRGRAVWKSAAPYLVFLVALVMGLVTIEVYGRRRRSAVMGLRL